MQRQSTLLFSGLAALNTLLTALPAIAFTAFNAGGTIPVGDGTNSGQATFNLNIDNTTGSSVTVSNVTLNIASLLAGADLADIELYLSSPGGTGTCSSDPCILTLKDALTNSGLTTYNNITFTDAAVSAIDTAVDNPVIGPFLPDGTAGTSLTTNISDFAGFQSVILGPGINTWQLTAFNFDDINTASISDITLNVTPVPIESDALPIVLSTGFMGVGIWAKRRFKNRQG